MTIKLYNTLTRKKGIFKPVEKGKLKIYVCGVTVYDEVHLGHAMSYIYYDMLINYFKHFHSYDVLYVRNITDVGHMTTDADGGEDKIEKRAIERKIHPMELVYKYTHSMWKNFDAINLDRPNLEPQASAHILEMQEWIKKMLKNGFAYEVNGNVYYDISKFENYGKFSNNNVEDMLKDTRFKNDEQKKHAGDFALWIKAEPKHILKWPSPWGEGYPGWHLECSVMGTKYLGDKFDIHGGGIEHLFPHHENEIAQNYGYFQKRVVNNWVHTALLMVDSQKMGKSKGNYITIEDFLKTHSPESLRYLVLSGHYRKPQNYTEKAITDSENAVERINNFILRLQDIKNEKESKFAEAIIENSIANFSKQMDDDLNTPAAFAEIFFLIKETNKLIDTDKINVSEAEKILNFLKKINFVFKIFTFIKKEDPSKPKKNRIKEPEILEQIKKRDELRKKKKWEDADVIRMNLQKKGVVLFDSKDGTTWRYE